MMRFSRPVTLLMSLILGAAVFASCSDGGSDVPAPTASPPAAATDPGQATSEPQATPEAAFQSFRYTVDFEATLDSPSAGRVTSLERHVEGVYAAPGSHAFTGAFGPQSPRHQAVAIGDDAWYREGGGTWQKMALSDLLVLGAVALTSAQPGFLNDAGLEEKLSGLESTPEETDGAAARKYTVPVDQVARVEGFLRSAFFQEVAGLEGFQLTLWVDDASGALLRAELSTTATPAAILGADAVQDIPPDTRATVALEIRLSQVNDSTIRISPPV